MHVIANGDQAQHVNAAHFIQQLGAMRPRKRLQVPQQFMDRLAGGVKPAVVKAHLFFQLVAVLTLRCVQMFADVINFNLGRALRFGVADAGHGFFETLCTGRRYVNRPLAGSFHPGSRSRLEGCRSRAD